MGRSTSSWVQASGPCAWRNAQASAIGFYLRHGFAARGERFETAGIEHQRMARLLTGMVAIEDREAAVAHTAALVRAVA